MCKMECSDSSVNNDRLRAVFDLCDTDKKGYLSVDHFVNLAREHFGAGDGHQEAEHIRRIVTLLDPEGDGKIHFQEFCQGVGQILELKSPASPTVAIDGPCPLLPDPRPLVLGGEHLLCTVTQEEDTNSSGTHETSELSTFNEYDMMTDDDQGPSAAHIDSTHLVSDSAHFAAELLHHPPVCSEDDRDSAFSARSSDTPEPRPETEGTDEEEKVYYDGGEEEGSDADSHSSPRHKKSDVRCHRRVTSNGLASQLFRVTQERRSSFGSDEIFDDIDGNFLELNDKVKNLEKQIHFLSDTQQTNDQRHIRMKEENCSLVERVHLLEEQLRDVEFKSRDLINEEQKKHREVMSRAEKDRDQEITILSQSLRHIEEEYLSLKEEAPRLRIEYERVKKENHQLEQQTQDLQQRLFAMAEEYKELQQHHQQDHVEMNDERKVNAQLIDELSRELEALRNQMDDSEVKVRGGPGDLTRTQRKELESTIIRLKHENVQLLEDKEELVLSTHIQEGRSLVNNGMSLAEEIENLPKDELLKTVREQQRENDTLREYIGRITIRIIEKNPSLLEIPTRNINKK